MSEYVYVFSAGGRSKIGYTRNPQRRVADLQTGCSDEIIVECLVALKSEQFARRVERLTHTTLEHAGFRLHGEWFDMPAMTGRLFIQKAAEFLGYEWSLQYWRQKEVRRQKKYGKKYRSKPFKTELSAKMLVSRTPAALAMHKKILGSAA